MNRKLIILRGCSGSGKTTLAKKMQKEALESGKTALICSADQYFVNPKSGRYEFDSRKLGNAHAYCRGKVEAAIWLGCDLIILDNTATRRWEFEPYIEMAERDDYEHEEKMVGTLNDNDLKVYANRNVHGVSLDIIRKMAGRFEV